MQLTGVLIRNLALDHLKTFTALPGYIIGPITSYFSEMVTTMKLLLRKPEQKE